MKYSSTKQLNQPTDAMSTGTGFWNRVRERLLSGLPLPGLGANRGQERLARHVKVWDRHRGSYRHVNLDDKADPLWSTAYAVAMQQKDNESHRTAA